MAPGPGPFHIAAPGPATHLSEDSDHLSPQPDILVLQVEHLECGVCKVECGMLLVWLVECGR